MFLAGGGFLAFIFSSAVGGVIGHYSVFGFQAFATLATARLYEDAASGAVVLSEPSVRTFTVLDKTEDLNPEGDTDTQRYVDIALYYCQDANMAGRDAIVQRLSDGEYGRIIAYRVSPSTSMEELLSARVTVIYDPQKSRSGTLESRLVPELARTLWATNEETPLQILLNPARGNPTDSFISIFFCEESSNAT